MGYKAYDKTGYNIGISRNDYCDRTTQFGMGEFHIRIPRHRRGLFEQHTISPDERNTGTFETTVVRLYEYGVSISEIKKLIEKMYDYHHSKVIIVHMAQSIKPLVEEFHKKRFSARSTVSMLTQPLYV